MASGSRTRCAPAESPETPTLLTDLLPNGEKVLELSPVIESLRRTRSTPYCRTQECYTLTDARIHLVKAALQPTPDQEKFWPAIEDAIRTRAKDRQARIAAAAARLREQHDHSPIEALRDRNPVEFMQRRAEALAQRAADLKKLADAWQPLYPTLSPEQKRSDGRPYDLCTS
jgi:hypothetical protein